MTTILDWPAASTTDLAKLRAALAGDDEDNRAAAAYNPLTRTIPGALERLARDRDWGVRCAVASQPDVFDLPADRVAALAADRMPLVARNLAHHADVWRRAPAIAATLAAHWSDEVRMAMAAYADLRDASDVAMGYAATDTPHVAQALATNATLAHVPAVVDALWARRDPASERGHSIDYARSALIRHGDALLAADPTWLDRAATDASVLVRCAVAEKAQLAMRPDLAHTLAADAWSTVHDALRRNREVVAAIPTLRAVLYPPPTPTIARTTSVIASPPALARSVPRYGRRIEAPVQEP